MSRNCTVAGQSAAGRTKHPTGRTRYAEEGRSAAVFGGSIGIPVRMGWFFSFCVLCTLPAFAQTVTFLGRVGSGTQTIPSSALPVDHVINLTSAVPAGSRVVITVLASANIPLADPTPADSAGNQYVGDVARFQNPVIIKSFSIHTGFALTASDSITVQYTSNGTGGSVESVVEILAFSNVQNDFPIPGVASESSSGTPGTALIAGSTTNMSPQENALLVSTFGTLADPGSLNIDGASGFTPTGSTICSGGNCLQGSYRIVGMAGTWEATATSSNSIDWMGVSSRFDDEQVPVTLQSFSVD